MRNLILSASMLLAAPCAVSEGVESIDPPASLLPHGQMNEIVLETAHVGTQRSLKKNKNKNKNNSDKNDKGNNNENQQQEEGAEAGGEEGDGDEASNEGNDEYNMEQDAQNYSDEDIESNYSGGNEQEGSGYSYSGENEQEENDYSSSGYDEQVSGEEIAYNYASEGDTQNGNTTTTPFRFMEIYETAPAEWNSSQWAMFTLFGSLLMMLSFIARDMVSKDDNDEREQVLYPKEIYPQPQPLQHQPRSKRQSLRNLFMRRSTSRLRSSNSVRSSNSSIGSHSSGFSHSETGAFRRWPSEDCEDVNYRRNDI